MNYVKQAWEDLPSESTPLSAARLNHLETQFDKAKEYVDSRPGGGGVTSVDGDTGPNVVLPLATSAKKGVTPLATASEVLAGSVSNKTVTPATLRTHLASRFERVSSTASGLGAGAFVGETALLQVSGMSLSVIWDGSSWSSISGRVAGTEVQRDALSAQGVIPAGTVWVYPDGTTTTRVGTSWVPDSLVTGRLEIMGTISRGSSGTGTWAPLSDSGHTPLGFGSISKGTDFLRIYYGFNAKKVVTFSATLDESFSGSSAKIAVGASVGLTYADLYFYFHNGTGTPPPQDPNALTTPNGNVWIHGVFLS